MERFVMIPFDPPIPPPRPPDEDPNTEFILNCKWEKDGSLEAVTLRRREVVKDKNVSYPVITERETTQLIYGRNLIQMRNPSGVVWKFAVDLKTSTPAREMPIDSGPYKVYLTWDKQKKLQNMEFYRRLPSENGYESPIAHKTYVIGDIFPEQRTITREMDGCLKSLILLVGARVGRFGPPEPPPNALRFRSFVDDGVVKSYLIPYSIGPIDDILETLPLVSSAIPPNHKKIREAVKFKRRAPLTPEQHDKKYKLHTSPILDAPTSVNCDEGEFIQDISEGPTIAPMEEQNMWPYLRRKYNPTEFFNRLKGFCEGNQECADFNAYVFTPSALQKMRQKARKFAEEKVRTVEEPARNDENGWAQDMPGPSHSRNL